MILRRCLFLLLAWSLVAVGRAAEPEVSRTFPVRPGATFTLDSHRGNVTVTEGDDPEIRVQVRMDVEADTEEEAARYRAELQLDMKAEENAVTVLARDRRARGPKFVWQEGHEVDLNYRITVPRRCDVTIRVREGGVTIGNLTGRMAAHVEQGSIFFRQIEGSIQASTRSGDITVSRCLGPVSAQVDRGMIRLGTILGEANLRNGSGDIEVMTAKGGVMAEAAAGDISVGFARELNARSRLATSGGNIFATVNEASACNVQASTVWGKVRSQLALTTDSGKNGSRKFAGRLNGGGPVLEFHANGGNVQLAGGEAPFD